MELDEYRSEMGVILEQITGGELSEDAVTEECAVHISILTGAIDSMAEALVQD